MRSLNQANNVEFVREDRFTTSDQDKAHQFEYWRDNAQTFFDVSLKDQEGEGFSVEIKGYDLGDIFITPVQLDAEATNRSTDIIRRYSLDHWILGFRQEGSSQIRSGDRILQSEAGTIAVRSLAVPFQANATRSKMLNVYLKRESFPDIANRLDQANNTIIDGPFGSLLREYLSAVETYLPILPISDVPVLTQSLKAIIRAGMRSTADSTFEARLPIAVSRFEMARKYIDAHLASPDLGPTALCLHLGISRRQLYYLFERRGGVANFIRRRRLEACHDAIANVANVQPINAIAYSYGFTNAALFGRQFRTEFGYAPGDVRKARLHRSGVGRLAPVNLSEWLLAGDT